MGLSASQGRLLLLTARQNDLEYRAQQISQQRLILSQSLESISKEYEEATSNRQMFITLYGTEASGDDKKTSKQQNLTYARLVSGTTMDKSYETSGINAISGVNISEDYKCNASFRLMSGDAIVVSSVSEIPGQVDTTTLESKKDASGLTVQTVKKQNTASNEKASEVKTAYAKVPAAGTKLGDLLKTNGDGADSLSFVTYQNEKSEKVYAIKYGDKYYSTDGKEEKDPKSATVQTYVPDGCSSVKFTSGSIPNSYSQTTGAISEASLNNGKYIHPQTGRMYIVDPALSEKGSDPNYLQDCLRNGKYTIDQFNPNLDEDSDDKKWKSVSWDSASYLSDQYYTDDDAAAKAKYDRLSNQIENQDKKLQLELDNIETQRDAVKTEVESVNKVISDNVENTFNAFS